MSTFSLECFQNEYLPEGGDQVNAIITVTGSGGGPSEPAAGGEVAELIILDVSASMTGRKLRQAADAARAAIDAVRDGVRFAVVVGNHQAWVLYPPDASLVTASADTRRAAKDGLRNLQASGGTAIGSWITLATTLLGSEPGMRHAILLTDGKDESEEEADLLRALTGATGAFQCDCRGVGTNWQVAELRRVADALLGSVDIVADPAELAADFASIMRTAMARRVAAVDVRVWSPQGADIEFVKQVAPDVSDLTDSRVPVNALVGDYPTGAWGDESRDYHVCVRVVPGGVGDEMLAARVTLMVDGEASGQGLIKAVWTDDTALSTRMSRHVAHYTGQAELADAIQEGLEARKAGDIDTATARLGRAVQLAEEAGNTDTARLLGKVVDVDDVGTGRVRLKAKVDEADEMTLDTRSTKTVRVHK
ncbi:MAG: VWA domain-containing protein [Actinomycetota bacterium]|nr:VWA domain-containing protein [Actinomycetota bacterium]